jgi:pimeloyl-ACP methyl ester carboxylesterase
MSLDPAPGEVPCDLWRVHQDVLSLRYTAAVLGSGWRAGKSAIVLIPGISGGLWCYVLLIRQLLRQEEDREIFIVELPYVSMRIVEDVPTMLETTSELCNMLAVYGHASAVFLGHSLGTAVAHGW